MKLKTKQTMIVVGATILTAVLSAVLTWPYQKKLASSTWTMPEPVDAGVAVSDAGIKEDAGVDNWDWSDAGIKEDAGVDNWDWSDAGMKHREKIISIVMDIHDLQVNLRKYKRLYRACKKLTTKSNNKIN